MTDPTPTDWRALCAELADAARVVREYVSEPCSTYDLDEALAAVDAALAQPEPQGPTDKELLELMPETMRDEFSYAANVCSDAIGGRVKPGIFRVALNTAALEYAHAVLTRWGRPAIEPVPVAERLPGLEDCDAEGRCWWGDAGGGQFVPSWRLCQQPDNPCFTQWLPHHALPVPQQEAE